MKQPTYQQISELYHELWELQHKLDDVESERDLYMKSRAQEAQYADHLYQIILRARDALSTGHIEFAKQELNKV